MTTAPRPRRLPGAAAEHRRRARADLALQRIAERCRRRVTRRALLSAGAAAVPVLGFDLLVDFGVLRRLLHEVNAEFGLTPAQIASLAARDRVSVYRAIDALGATAVGRVVTAQVVALLARRLARRLATKTLLRHVPLAGTAIAAALSFAALKALGDRHVADCLRVARAARRSQRLRARSVAPVPR